MNYPWSGQIEWFKSGECQVCMEALDELDQKGISYTPRRKDLFKAYSTLKFDDVRCVIVGQDPYPNLFYATGVAFSIPEHETSFPPTLQNIFKEYQDDLGYPIPKSGDLKKWTDQGVLLLNALPVCVNGKPLTCPTQDEWQLLNKEVISKLSERALVFGLIGGVARELSKYINTWDDKSKILATGHPSPRGNINSKTPFNGSRFFSTLNDLLNQQGLKTINWRLE